MANRQHLEKLEQGIDIWNRWRADNPAIVPDLSGADLHGWDLSGVNLDGAILFEANLTWTNLSLADLNTADLRDAVLNFANLSGADLGGSNLSGAHLVKADLSSADVSGADLDMTDLVGADLARTNFNNADLNGADLTKAEFGLTVLGNVDLRSTKGLDAIIHHGPSTIGIDTLYMSQGKIPEVFLRGAGVPDNLIVYIGSLVGKAIEYYSCFISHSSRDQEFVVRLHADLQEKGVRCWYAPEELKGGKNLYEQLSEAIRYHDKLLLVLSEHSMVSKWVETEIKKAKEREEKEARQILFPISLINYELLTKWELFDSDRGTDLAAYVRSYFIPDFEFWKNQDLYKVAFERLLRDLQASDVRTRRG